MSKVYENGIIRDATPEEQVDINSVGGGTSRFELIVSGSISNTTRQPISIPHYDELYVVLENVKGSGTLVEQLQVETTTTTTTRLNDFLSDVAKYVKTYTQRLTPTDFFVAYNGTSINTTPQITSLVTPDGITYDNKIIKYVIACTGTDSIIESCDYKIYGRNLVNI